MTTKSFDDYLKIIESFYRPPQKEDEVYSWLLFARNCWCPEIARYAEDIRLGAPDSWLNEPMVKQTLWIWCGDLSRAMTGLLRTDQTKEYDFDVLNKTLKSFDTIQILLNSLHMNADSRQLYYNVDERPPMTDVSFYGFLYLSGIFNGSSLCFSPEMIDDERHFFTFLNDRESLDNDYLNGFMCATKNENIAQIFFRVFKPLFPNLFTLGMSIEQWNNLDLTAMRMDLNPAIEALEALPEPTGSVPAEEEKKEKPYTLTDRQLEYCEIKAYSDGDDIIKSDGLRWLANKIWGEKKEHDTTGTDHSRWLSKNAKNNVKIKRHPDNGDWWIFTPEKDCFKPAKQGRPRIHN